MSRAKAQAAQSASSSTSSTTSSSALPRLGYANGVQTNRNPAPGSRPVSYSGKPSSRIIAVPMGPIRR